MKNWREILLSVLDFRGTGGWPLRVWLPVLIATWLIASGWSVVEPAFSVLPPFLTLAVLMPCVSALLRVERGGLSRRIEPVIVMLGFGGLSWVVWAHLFREGIYADNLDHQIMIARAEEFLIRLGRGEWPRYSHYAEGGDSLSDMYPFFFNFIPGVFWKILKKGTAFETAWTAAIVWLWWLRGVASYAVARRFCGPLLSLTLALCSLLEVGEDVWDGVWDGTLRFGMVHNNFAISLGMLATSFQLDLFRKFKRESVALAAAFIVIACLAHPLGVIWVGLSTASLTAAVLVGRGRLRRGARVVVVSVLALMIASAFVLPFSFLMKHYGFYQPVGGGDYGTLGAGLLAGKLPQSSFPALFALGSVAALAAIASRDTRAFLVGFMAFALWLMALTPFLIQIGFYRLVPGFLDGQQRRMLTLLKTAMIPASAWFFAFLLRRFRSTRSLHPGRVVFRAALLSLLLLGPGRGVASGFEATYRSLVARIPKPENFDKSRHRANSNEHLESVIDWLTQARIADRSPSLWRIALHYPYYEPTHARLWGASWRMGVPVVDFVWMSAVFLGNRPREISLQGYQDWNVRYAVTILNTALPLPAGTTELKFSAGDYRVYEVKNFDRSLIKAPPGVKISDVAIQGDEIAFSVSGAPEAGADLLVRVGYLPRWVATLDGRSIPVRGGPPHPGAIVRQEQVLVHSGNGRVVVRANGTLPRAWLGRVLAVLGAAGLALVLSGRRLQLEERALELLRRAADEARARWALWRRWMLPALGGLLGLSSLIAWGYGSRRLLAPAIEGDGLKVSMPGVARCIPMPWLGATRCSASGTIVAEVRAALGADPSVDSTGEFALLWPGVHVSTPRPGKVFLTVPRFRAGQGLSFKFSTSGAWKVQARMNGVPLGNATAEGRGRFQIGVPEGAPRSGALTLELESAIPNAAITLAGGS